VLGGVDDGPLRTVLEHCARLGIEVWGHVGLWSYGGDVYPEYAMRTLDGQPLAAGQARWGIGLCPSRPRINEWVRAGLVEVVSKYGLTGLCVDHARYPGPASLSSLSGCGCQFCQDAAAGLGLDFGSIRAGVRGWLEERGQLDARRLQALLAGRGCGWELAELRRGGGVLAAWLDLRAALLAARMQEFRVAVRNIGGAGFVFGSDVFAPSVAWLVDSFAFTVEISSRGSKTVTVDFPKSLTFRVVMASTATSRPACSRTASSKSAIPLRRASSSTGRFTGAISNRLRSR